jgi:hypothetical protein
MALAEEVDRFFTKKGYVCGSCGGIIEGLETINGYGKPVYWAGCKMCNKFTSGVLPEDYEIAKDLIVHHFHLHGKQDSGEIADVVAIVRVFIEAQQGKRKREGVKP